MLNLICSSLVCFSLVLVVTMTLECIHLLLINKNVMSLEDFSVVYNVYKEIKEEEDDCKLIEELKLS